MSNATVIQLDYELGEFAKFGPYQVQIIAVTHHVNGAVIYHVTWHGDDDDVYTAEVASAQLE